MVINLTDEQTVKMLENVPERCLFEFLKRNKRRSFLLFCELLKRDLNSEAYIKELNELLAQIPIQKELF